MNAMKPLRARGAVLRQGLLLSILLLGVMAPSFAYATANSCFTHQWTPVAWTADGTKLLAEVESDNDMEMVAPGVEVWKVGADSASACYSFEEGADPTEATSCPLEPLGEFPEEQAHGVEDTGLLRTYTAKAKPLSSARVRVRFHKKR